MKVVCLVEDTSHDNLVKAIHGLSFYIEAYNHKILFDVGPDNTFIKNAKIKNIDLKSIDTVIISHGHADHGGGLKYFLKINKTAAIYIQNRAFEPHYSIYDKKKNNISLSKHLMKNKQIKLISGDYRIDDVLSLITVSDNSLCHSPSNDHLFAGNVMDDFKHEQSLLIKGKNNLLVVGCGHNGIVNILNKCPVSKIDYCLGGYHLSSPRLNETVNQDLILKIAEYLKKYQNTLFYTCHCTSKEAYTILKDKLSNMNYISCGDEINI